MSLSLSILLLSLFSVSFAVAAEPSVEGAKKEGSLVFYTTMDIQNSKPVIDAFTKKYPFVRGDLVRLGGTAMVSRIIAEAQAGAQ
jgi:ABC-type glycerol-3-phosphate transport system substrate-binding protein